MSAHPFALHGKTALVTGAGRGLGLAIAKALAQAGALVLLNGRTEAPLAEAARQIAAEGGAASVLAFDVTDQRQVEEAFAQITGLDILVNNVGLRDRRPVFDFSLEDVRKLISLEDVRKLIEADLIAPFELGRRAARLMIDKAQGGRIINITSIAGLIANKGDAVYTTAKGGLMALTRALAAELGTHAITVNAVAPGFFATETNAALSADAEVADWLKKRTALGRWGEPAEIAGAVVFLASPAASYVTGHMLAVDGGYLTHF
jgi:gluconate 5-dehydrogenase